MYTALRRRWKKESERVNVKQLAVFVQTAPVSGSNPKRIRKADIQKLRKPESVSHIFSIIVSYMDYNSYYLLSCVVRKRRTRRMIRKYKREVNASVQSVTLLTL